MASPLFFTLAFLAITVSTAPAAVTAADEGRQEVMAADRAFAAAVAAGRLDAWMEFMAPDAARLPQVGMKAVRGHDAIRELDAAIFADSGRRLRWAPTDGGIFDDPRYGFTSGRYEVVQKQPDGSERVTGKGGYITFWRRNADGEWKVILDTGAPDLQP